MAPGDGDESALIEVLCDSSSNSLSTSQSPSAGSISKYESGEPAPLGVHEEPTETGFPLLKLPMRIRFRLWTYLDAESLLNVSRTCTTLRNEVSELLPTSQLQATFLDIIIMVPDIPLNQYIDTKTWNNLRLVCKELKGIIDTKSVREDESRRIGSRWCMLHDLVHPDALEYGHHRTNIFDLHTMEMEKIMSYLPETDLDSLGKVCRVFKRLVEQAKLYPFQESHGKWSVDWSQFYLMDLPTVVQEKILSFCLPPDRANLRLVSKLMQYQVDTLAGVTVHLNDLKWDWNPFCGTLPPSHTLIVTNIENLRSINYFITDYNCKLLTRLLLDGPFLAKAMILILRRCKNLRYIGFTYALHMSSVEDELRKSFPVQRPPLELASLTALNLKMREVEMPSNNIFRVHAWSWANAFEFMRPNLFHMPRLSSFHICEENMFSHSLMHEVAEKILKFLVAHRYTLKYLSIILDGNCFRECSCPAYHFENAEERLREIQLIKLCYDCDWRISRPFTTILTAQRSLSELCCFKLSDWEFYAGVITLNQETLRSVKIEKNMSPLIDLSVFAPCKKLECLWISQCGSSNMNQTDQFYVDIHLRSWARWEPRMIGMDQLPTNLKSLHIFDQSAESSQVRSIPLRLKKLETLEIQFLGSCWGKDFGLSMRTILDILHLPRLECVFLEEIRRISDSYHADPGHDDLSKINLIKCSAINLNYSCILFGVLVAEKMPNNEYWPEWQSRISRYTRRQNTAEQDFLARDEYLTRVIPELELGQELEEEEEEDLYSNEASDEGEDEEDLM